MPITRRCQSNQIERFSQLNQSNSIERNRLIEIRLSNAIELQSNLKIGVMFDCVRRCSIPFDWCSIVFDWCSIVFDWCSIVFDWFKWMWYMYSVNWRFTTAFDWAQFFCGFAALNSKKALEGTRFIPHDVDP